jgi:hypothetical protein
MSSDTRSDDFLEDLELAVATGDRLQRLAERLSGTKPRSELRARILESVERTPRFAASVDHVADLLDIPIAAAQRELARLDDASNWLPALTPGMEVCNVRGGPAVADAVSMFIRLTAGTVMPEHEHIGVERGLILQGSCIDGQRTLRAGDLSVMPAGTRHSLVVRGGPDLIYLGIAHHGVRFNELDLYVGPGT